jgi:transcriptional antiterminator Rof (Rho-off)
VSDYRPVDCATYAGLELAILRRLRLLLGWRDPGGLVHLERVRPIDLRTARGEEFLVFRTRAGAVEKVRLDRICRARPLRAGAPMAPGKRI